MRKKKRKRVAVARQPMPAPTHLNDCGALDLMSDPRAGGRRFRILNKLEVVSRQGWACEVDTSLPAARVIGALDEIALERGYPARITVANGPEFRGRALAAWASSIG